MTSALPEPIAVTLLVVTAFEALHVPYFIGGSLASAVQGVSRATMDADLMADLEEAHIPALIQALGDAFYFDAETIRSAVRRRSTFNVIHLKTMFKVDVFVNKRRPFDEAQFARRTRLTLIEDSDASAYLASAEDTILAKLDWYRQGGEVSDRQWRDILGVLRVQQGRLDAAYLRHWAAQLSVTDLLARAERDAAG